MITLIGAALGLLGSVVPEFFKFFNSRQDNKHELDVMDKQLELAKLGGQQRLEEINTQADIAESAALNQRITLTGIRWVDALSTSVRPVITYSFFLAYIVVKYAQFQALGSMDPLPWMSSADGAQKWFSIVVGLWNEEDQGLFAAIMTFWFGTRTYNKRGQ